MMVRPSHSDDSAILFGFGHDDSAIPFGIFGHYSDSARFLSRTVNDLNVNMMNSRAWRAMKIAAVAFPHATSSQPTCTQNPGNLATCSSEVPSPS